MIKVEHISMKFRMNSDRVQSLKEFAIAAATHRLTYKDFWVFQDVSFAVEKGEVMGIIGRNGAGKSTLLKIISGILEPASGRVELSGRIVPMLELGSGFDYELTGRENIFLNGSVLGYSEQFLKEKYEEIVQFSELGDFIETPIRNYSSGMMMRLAFSIATVVQPEILIVDEILAVGDEAFQKKSKRKMLELMGGGTTVLFVSHSLAQIREMCSRVVWLENGRVRMEGETKYVCDKYEKYLQPQEEGPDQRHKRSDAHRNLSDVLFIYGDDGNAYAWRVTYQREQLLAGAVPTNEVSEQDIQEDMAKLYRVFICVRCTDTPKLYRLLCQVKKLHKKIWFDFSGCSEQMQKPDPQETLFAKVKSLCDGVIVTNKKLAERYAQAGCEVFYNPLAVDERMAEYASWAVYDRDVLPGCDTDTLSDEELVNYNRAVSNQRKRKADGGRIGFFAKTWRDGRGQAAAAILQPLLKEHKDLRLVILDTGEELPAHIRPFEDQMIFIRKESREELLRGYAQADIVLLLNMEKNGQDLLLQSWLCAALVKVPCFFMDAHAQTQAGIFDTAGQTVVFSCQKHTDADKELYGFLKNEALRLQIGQAAYAYAKRRHSSVHTGKYIGRLIRKTMQPNLAFAISKDRLQAYGQTALHHAALMSRQGYDVLVLTTGKEQKDLLYEDRLLPVISRELVYSYQYFDVVVSFDWECAKWMQNYTNVKRRIYFVTDYEPDDYEIGNTARLEAEQMYQPRVAMEFAAASGQCEGWLRKDYGQKVKVVHTDEEITEFYRGNSERL